MTKMNASVDQGPEANWKIARSDFGPAQGRQLRGFLDLVCRFGHCSFLLSVALPSPQTNNPKKEAPERLIEPGDVCDFGARGAPASEKAGGIYHGGKGVPAAGL